VITAVLGTVVLVALAGARRTDTAVSRFLQYAGPSEGQVEADSRTLDKVAALPSVGYAGRAALMLAFPAVVGGRMVAVPGQSQVITVALIDSPPQVRVISVAGRQAVSSRASEVMIDEAAARALGAHIGSVIHLRGYRPDQFHQVLNGAVLRPGVALPGVRVVGIIRTPADLTENPDVPSDVTFAGRKTIYATAALTTGSPPPWRAHQHWYSI
jgi:hypothetical protein